MKEFLTIKQIAERLGTSNSLIYSLVEQKKIEHVRIGKAIRIHQESFKKFIKKSKTNTEEEEQQP